MAQCAEIMLARRMEPASTSRRCESEREHFLLSRWRSPAMAPGKILEEITSNSGKLYDATDIESCLRVLEDGLSLRD